MIGWIVCILVVLIIYHASEITWRAGSITNCGLHCRVFDSGCCRQGLRICIPNTFLGVPAAGGLRTIPGEYIPTPQRHMKLLPSLFLFSIHLYFSGIMFGPLFNRNHAAIRRKPEHHTHIYSPGFFRISRTPGPTFPSFLVYLHITVVGNLGMIIIIKVNSKLHTIMYFFLSHLSFVDFCFSFSFFFFFEFF